MDVSACALKHENSWDASGVGENGVLDLQKLGCKEEISMRVRVGRNLEGFNLPGAMDKAAEFRRLRYPPAVLYKACAVLGATTGEGAWIRVRDELRRMGTVQRPVGD